jgi:hypothetical protein
MIEMPIRQESVRKLKRRCVEGADVFIAEDYAGVVSMTHAKNTYTLFCGNENEDSGERCRKRFTAAFPSSVKDLDAKYTVECPNCRRLIRFRLSQLRLRLVLTKESL